MIHLTTLILTDSVAAMADVFDSHDVINHILTVYPQQYILESNTRVAMADPIHETHKVIGSTLLEVEGIEKHGRVVSRNIRGQATECQRWRKVAVPAAAMAT
jgi:hypothetical protein